MCYNGANFASFEVNVENLEHKAAALFGKKEFAQALELYQLMLQGQPKNEKYLIACGNCYDSLGDKDKAVAFYFDAVKQNKNSEAGLLNLSTVFYELKDYHQAANYAHQVLKINANNIAAWQNLANVSFCNADYDTALKYYQKMYEYNNNSYIAMINIANTYYCMGKYVLALEFAKKSLNKHPSSISAHILAGNALSAMGKYEKAIAMYSNAYEQDKSRIEVMNALSDAYRATNDWENCLLFGWRYVKNTPTPPPSMQLNFGYLLYECYSERSVELAKNFATKWLKFFPQDKIVQHMAMAILDGHNLQNSDAEFIKATFDAFAPDFEQTLAELDYQAPNLIFTALSHHLKHFLWNKYHIVDLGCGTGLCGLKIKKFATFKGLIGIDLSENMIAQAAKKKIYSQLICDDICHYLENTSYFFNIAVAADVWTYFGDLTKPFVRVSRSLTPDGLFVFTFSENSFNDNDFFLTPSGRFVHNPVYVEKVLKSAGLRILSMERHILRNEAEKPVYGYIAAAQKPNLAKQPFHAANGEK